MESSEDDAGAATNASRRASAREKDVGTCEDGGPSGGTLLDATEAGAASETTSMSEEAFDADSVPSPSAQDVNTSTEAILDMIDEIVDGPDAPKRRSRASEEAEAVSFVASTDAEASVDEQPPSECNPQTSSTLTSTDATSDKNINVSQESECDVSLVCKSQSSTAKDNVYMSQEIVNNATTECKSETPTENTSKEDAIPECLNSQQPESGSTSEEVSVQPTVDSLPLACPSNVESVTNTDSSVPIHSLNEVLPANVSVESVSHESTMLLSQSSSCELTQDPQLPLASSSLPSSDVAESTSEEAPSSIPLNIPSSSVKETESESVLDSSENQASERTIKCVTSSDTRDNVMVESAESTSSDSSASEVRTTTNEAATRSPLRRRLVRPVLSDRRPDSTVSSTVDSQTVNVHTTEQSTSECIAKDVSSSSDAVPSVYGNVKPEEIRNLSEISVCKAETSMNPPKKIKLIRNKASLAQRDNISDKPLEPELCQSTSSECTPSVLSETYVSPQCEVTAPNVDDQCVSNESSVNMQETVNKYSESPDNQNALPENTITQAIALKEAEIVTESEEQKKVPPIKLNLIAPESIVSEKSSDSIKQENAGCSSSDLQENTDSSKQVPKLTIKIGNKPEEPKSPIPKLTIKPIRPPTDIESPRKDFGDQIPSITKLNIKPILKPAEKVNDLHRKSSSSEISESESSENDESNSTSDQASNSDQFTSDIVPKVTIKVGKPGTESEGKFYTEQNAPKLVIKGIQSSENDDSESVSKLKLIISQPEDKQSEKVPKLTIKTISKSEGQPLSPKLTIKPLKPPDNVKREVSSDTAETHQIPKLKIATDSFSSTAEIKEYPHVPKITIKPVPQTSTETSSNTPKKSSVVCDSPEHIPVVTKLNIKPILKPVDEDEESTELRVPVVSKLNIKPIVKPTTLCEPTENLESQVPIVSRLNIKPIIKPTETGETSEKMDENIPVVAKLNIKPIFKPDSIDSSEGNEDKVPVVSKLNIKPIVKPKDNEVESSLEDIPKVTKLNIKPLKNPEAKTSDEKDCDELNADTEMNSIPVVTKINIKPIIKPVDEETSKDSENQSSETGNSSDDNTDHIPVVTKINIKPILKPCDTEESVKPNSSNEEIIPVITKLNIKPLIKPEESKSPSSPKKDSLKITKLNIKPVLKPEEIEQQKLKCENQDSSTKNPPLVMKINFKSVTEGSSNENLSSEAVKEHNNVEDNSIQVLNNVEESIPKVSKLNIKPIIKPPNIESSQDICVNSVQTLVNCKASSSPLIKNESPKQNCIPISYDDSDKHMKTMCVFEENPDLSRSKSPSILPASDRLVGSNASGNQITNDNVKIGDVTSKTVDAVFHQTQNKTHASLQNCTLLKKLLETKKDGLDKRLDDSRSNVNHLTKEVSSVKNTEIVNSESSSKEDHSFNKINDVVHSESSTLTMEEKICSDASDNSASNNMSKPLQISISDKYTNQSSGPDSPRIILKINKTDHGASAKIITEERPATPQQNDIMEHGQDLSNEKQNQKRIVNSRKKSLPDTPNVNMGKRLRSSRIVENTGKSPPLKRNIGKRPTSTETSPVQSKEPELSILETKRLKLGQILSNKSLASPTMSVKAAQLSPTKTNLDSKQTGKIVNHSVLNNENYSKNGNSKLHNILSNLQAKQAQALALNDVNCSEKISVSTELDSNASTGSSDVVEIVPSENSRPIVQEMIINENSESHDFHVVSDEISQDPLEVNTAKANEPAVESPNAPLPMMTPQPKKRGRPRKLPVSEGAKPAPVVLPVSALEERPQRSLRLSRDQSRVPTILAKPRGRGRGRGAKRAEQAPSPEEPAVDAANKFFADEPKPAEDIDPTSSRIKLPRMTEALDKSTCTTPLTSRRRNSGTEPKMFESEPKVVLDMLPKLEDVLLKSPEQGAARRGGRGARGGRGRTPRGGRGRGRGGGRGAVYMKETMGIYGRVCGPATTTVQLFEEETCMMDDNATPAKPSHLLDEDSQSSVMSSTNDSSKMRKSKFADLFDSNKVWTAADVKEYMWPPPEQPDVEHQVMMIQEQVAMFLNVKSFKRRYPELKRRTIVADERDYVLSKGLVTEALCDLGITAVDASEVLDIMLSDYPHKYEEYRSHQRQKQLAAAEEAEVKPEPRIDRVEMKAEVKPAETKPEPPKVDLEKTRQEALAAAIASASEWNARVNASRAAACADLQSHTVLRRRVPPRPPPRAHVQPPAGFYPHALLPGQYQHTYRLYAPDQLRYFPLNTVTAAPPVPPSPAPSESESDNEWRSSSSSDDSRDDRPAAKRKKLTKTKRSSSGAEAGPSRGSERDEAEVDLCRVCKLRLEANRKHTHERFLVCANCNAKLHPGCVELSADTIRKVREYAWQCTECKTCCSCQTLGDDDKMLFCDLCDRGFHIYCVGIDKVPSGRWHCVECAICKSCGAREPGGLAAGGAGAGADTRWHHQTRRGPGGHKLYSHSLCTPCARAYRIGRYCPLCERSFIGPKGTMQLVICKLCDRQHHQECVRQTVSSLNVLDYTCGECRRGGITSRAAAVRLAPRTIATLFMAKRRFNKYAHRQYLQSRQQQAKAADDASTDAADESCEPEEVCEAEPEEVCEAEPEEVCEAEPELEAEAEAEAEAGSERDPLEGAGEDEAAAAVASLRMDFGD